MTNAAITVSRANPLARKLSRNAAQGIAALATELTLDWQEAAFLVLRDAGLTQKAAYLLISPDVTEESAEALGYRWERKLSHVPRPLDLNLIQAALADIVAIQGMLDGNASLRDKLTAADQTNRKLQRYADGQVQVNVLAGLQREPTAAPMPMLPPSSSESHPGADS